MCGALYGGPERPGLHKRAKDKMRLVLTILGEESGGEAMNVGMREESDQIRSVAQSRSEEHTV